MKKTRDITKIGAKKGIKYKRKQKNTTLPKIKQKNYFFCTII
jgi:hypothetical protein